MSASHRRRIPVVAGLVAALALAAGGPPSTAAGTKTIKIMDNAFSPKRTTVTRNTLVTWRWATGSGTHDIVSRGTKRFKSSALKSSGEHRVRLTKPGTYRYVCTIHEDEGMTGRIIVR